MWVQIIAALVLIPVLAISLITIIVAIGFVGETIWKALIKAKE